MSTPFVPDERALTTPDASSAPDFAGDSEPASFDPLAGLVARIALKDQAALTELYDFTASRLFSLALALVRTYSNAEEVLGDVYCQVWQSAARYEPKRGTVLVWLLVLCRTRAIDHYRTVRRRSKYLTEFQG